MPLPKGKTNNPNGRPPGSKNKNTKQLREWVTGFIDANTSQIEKDWKQLEPKDRITAFQQLLKYSLPTLQAVNVTNDLEMQLQALTDDQLEELMNKILEHYNH